jgi:hypothetical protein
MLSPAHSRGASHGFVKPTRPLLRLSSFWPGGFLRALGRPSIVFRRTTSWRHAGGEPPNHGGMSAIRAPIVAFGSPLAQAERNRQAKPSKRHLKDIAWLCHRIVAER